MRVGGEVLDFSTPVVMGILNVTPDSFYDGGSYRSETQIIGVFTRLSKKGDMLPTGCNSFTDSGHSSLRPPHSDRQTSFIRL